MKSPTYLPPLRLAPDSLGFALDGAAQAIDAVSAGLSLPNALRATRISLKSLQSTQPTQSVPSTSSAAIQDIAYRTLRRLGSVDWLIAQLVRKTAPPHIGNLLRCALALLCEDPAAYAPFTVVDQAVSAIGARREFAFAKGLVNAVLRTFLRKREALLSALRDDPVACWNYPAWWIDATQRAWPDTWQAILAAGDRPGPLTLRVNTRRSTVSAYLQTLRESQIEACLIGAQAVRLRAPIPVERIPGFADGVVSVQDAGAQLAAQWLDVHDGMRVLDACAAPGGKTGHLLELADLDLIALERDPARAARIDENLARLGLKATVRIADAGDPSSWHDGVAFDRILADVPCSASGIVRRHPDIRWLRRQTDIAALAAEQQRILRALWPLVKPGGELLYVTCSIFPAEGEHQAQWFEAAHADAVRLRAPGQLVPSVSNHAEAEQCGSEHPAGSAADHDGFFYGRFQKR